ncbi:phage-related protein [Methanobacterium formicicum]|uniref:Phage-related protein n=1 Tax=Methanobacterium formicicum TaxID=2162 RepID=A0A089ZII2_METFO|nr:hypothetical protein [Methanobacterium formicicum]AIS32488.1 phage-related protein [Methanobacterium formicicum]
MVLRKEDILKGIEDPELVKIKSLGGELPLRPLSKAEWNKIEQIEAKAYGTFEANETAKRGKRKLKNGMMETKGKIDLEKQNKAEFKGKTQALYLSMNNSHVECDKWTELDIQKLPVAAFDEIFEKVKELSGIPTDEDEGEDEKKELDNFPEQS